MAPHSIDPSVATLRAITFRISSVSTAQLPQQTPAISASLLSCKRLLSSNPNSISKSASDSSVIIHKYRTQLSALLQDRTVQGRLSAIILIKATIEIGGWETLQKSLPWVRGLLSILNKPDPPHLKRLCIITLTRIFLLTRDYPTLIREITTPSLPTFVQSCLNSTSSTSSSMLLSAVLESFHQLLPRHPTIFRSYQKQMSLLLVQLVAPTPSNIISTPTTFSPPRISSELSHLSRKLYVQLHYCAPKNASAEEWETSLKITIANAHRIADMVFRAVTEEWLPNSGIRPISNGSVLDAEVLDSQQDPMGLPGWSGISAGSERLQGLLRLIKEYIASSMANPINFRVDLIMDVLTRLFYLTVPSASADKSVQTVKFNNEISKDEREILWTLLPHLHVTGMDMLVTLLQRYEQALSPLTATLIDQLIWVFGAEGHLAETRAATYRTVSQILKISGTTLPRSSVDLLRDIICACCDDLLPQFQSTQVSPSQPAVNGKPAQQVSTNADSFLSSSYIPKAPTVRFAGLHDAAHNLLPLLLSDLPTQCLSVPLRSRIDRTAILVQHKGAMTSSVLNPPPIKGHGRSAPSVMPLMARFFPCSSDVEGLLKPRMPVVRTGRRTTGSGADEEQGDEEDDDDEQGAEKESSDEVEVTSPVADDTMGIVDGNSKAVDPANKRVEFFNEPPKAVDPQIISTGLNASSAKSDDPMEALDQSLAAASSSKRESDDSLTSLSKRAKLDSPSQEAQKPQFTFSASASPDPKGLEDMQPAEALSSRSDVFLGANNDLVSMEKSSIATKPAEDSDSNDDDFGALVLGQDTDDDSDS